MQYDKCPKCKCYRLPNQFLNAKGRKLKTCDICRERGRKRKEKYKCEHNKQKASCKECGGSQICEHNINKYNCVKCKGNGICHHDRIKAQCKECKGNRICKHNKYIFHCKDCGCVSLCIHNKRKDICKKCMTPEECILFIKKCMVWSSRTTDRKKELYDANNHIDLCFLDGLFEDYEKCPYCDVDFTYEERCKTLVTIERKDNSIGHTKANCILCCFRCNSLRVGQ